MPTSIIFRVVVGNGCTTQPELNILWFDNGTSFRTDNSFLCEYLQVLQISITSKHMKWKISQRRVVDFVRLFN